MKVVLIQCPVWGTREPPLAIVQLSGCLKSAGIETKSFDFNNFLYRNREDKFINLWAWEQSMFWYSEDKVKEFFISYSNIVDSYIDEILKFGPDIAGFSVSASTFYSSCRFATRLKEIKKDIKIIFGGPAFFNRRYIEKSFCNAPVDFILEGEADLTFPQLIMHLEMRLGFQQCLGIYFKENIKIGYTGARPPMRNLDKIPYSDFTDLKIEDYDDIEHVSIMASRGCIWNCAFCSSKAFWRQYRYMSGERIHQEITFHRITRKKLGHVDFMDLVFNGNLKRVQEFCELMIKYQPLPSVFPDIKWVANEIVHPGLTKDVLAMMKEAGCKKLIFGIESGSQRVLQLMRKPYKIADAKRIMKEAYEVGIQVTNNFMFGFPGESREPFVINPTSKPKFLAYFTASRVAGLHKGSPPPVNIKPLTPKDLTC